MEGVLNEVEAHRPRTAGGAVGDVPSWSASALRRPSRAPVPAMSFEQVRLLRHMCCLRKCMRVVQAAVLAGLPGAASAERPVTSAPPRPGKALAAQATVAPAIAGDSSESARGGRVSIQQQATRNVVEVAPDVLSVAPWAVQVVCNETHGRHTVAAIRFGIAGSTAASERPRACVQLEVDLGG